MNEPPLTFDSMEKCVRRGYDMTVSLMYMIHDHLIKTIFEGDIKGWKGIMKYEI